MGLEPFVAGRFIAGIHHLRHGLPADGIVYVQVTRAVSVGMERPEILLDRGTLRLAAIPRGSDQRRPKLIEVVGFRGESIAEAFLQHLEEQGRTRPGRADDEYWTCLGALDEVSPTVDRKIQPKQSPMRATTRVTTSIAASISSSVVNRE